MLRNCFTARHIYKDKDNYTNTKTLIPVAGQVNCWWRRRDEVARSNFSDSSYSARICLIFLFLFSLFHFYSYVEGRNWTKWRCNFRTPPYRHALILYISIFCDFSLFRFYVHFSRRDELDEVVLKLFGLFPLRTLEIFFFP